MMDVLLHVTNPDSARAGAALARACKRAGLVWGCFLTNDGVRALAHPPFAEALRAASRAVACEKSWRQHLGATPCSVELGSQTDNSALMAQARRLVSL